MMEFSRSAKYTAKKPHKCFLCDEQIREGEKMSNKIRRIFCPTPEEELEDVEKIAEIREALKGTCSACIHHEESDLPGYFTDYGRCRVGSPLFGDIVTNPLVKCPSYQDREQTPGPTVKCRYVYGDNICERHSGNGEIVYCVEGPCLDEVIQDET